MCIRDRPWRFDFEGVCDEAFETTDGQCVSYQLSKHLVRKGRPAFIQEELTTRLNIIAQQLYANSKENPYMSENDAGQPVTLECDQVGVTTAVVTQLCREIGCPIHVLWSNSKIESYTPLRPKLDRICFLIYGDHA